MQHVHIKILAGLFLALSALGAGSAKSPYLVSIESGDVANDRTLVGAYDHAVPAYASLVSFSQKVGGHVVLDAPSVSFSNNDPMPDDSRSFPVSPISRDAFAANSAEDFAFDLETTGAARGFEIYNGEPGPVMAGVSESGGFPEMQFQHLEAPLLDMRAAAGTSAAPLAWTSSSSESAIVQIESVHEGLVPAVPEPSTYALLLAGLPFAAWARRCRNRKAAAQPPQPIPVRALTGCD